ncbi:hypothetical protein ACOMHN_058566 [Nucella lapillus]
MFFSAIKAVYGPSRPSTSPLLSLSGTLLKEKSAINERRRENFSTLLNRPSTVSSEALDQIPQRPAMDSLDAPPTMEEVTKAIHQTSSGKATGMDGIPAEFFKAAGPVALEAFHGVLCSIWDTEDMTQEFRDATIVSLYKNKSSKSDWKLPWHIPPVYRRQDHGAHHSQSPDPHCLREQPAGSTVRLPPRPQHS